MSEVGEAADEAFEKMLDAAKSLDEALAVPGASEEFYGTVEDVVEKAVEKARDALTGNDLYNVGLVVVGANIVSYLGYRFIKWQVGEVQEKRMEKQRRKHQAHLDERRQQESEKDKQA